MGSAKFPLNVRAVFGPKLTVHRFVLVSVHLIFSYWFLFFWAGARVYQVHLFRSINFSSAPPMKANWWLFGTYAGVAPMWFFSVLLDAYSQGTLVSKTVFELIWVPVVCAFNLRLIPLIVADLQDNLTPTHKEVIFSFEVGCLLVATLIGLAWVVVLFAAALENHLRLGHSEVWTSGIRDFHWYGMDPVAPQPYTVSTASPLRRLLIGRSRDVGVRDAFYRPLSHLIWNHTPFRRLVGIEPIWLALTRGTVAVAFVAGLGGYAVLQCIVNPLTENDRSLPTRPLPYLAWTGTPPFFAIDALTWSFSVHLDGSWFNETAPPILPRVQANWVDGGRFDCSNTYFNTSRITQYTCNTWDEFCANAIGFSINVTETGLTPWLDSTQMTITMTLDWTPLINQGYNLSNVVAMAGSDGKVFESLWTEPIQPIPMPRRFQHPSWLRIRPGQNIRAAVETYRIFVRQDSFLDILGLPMSPVEIPYHPFSSVEITSTSTEPVSTVTFVPTYGLLDHQWIEEYRESTVISGLASTGGIFSILDLVFGILFGRKLLAVVFGGKPVSTFGVVSSIFGIPDLTRRMKRKYPDLGSSDHLLKAHSTTEFLHDFIVDFGPGFDGPDQSRDLELAAPEFTDGLNHQSPSEDQATSVGFSGMEYVPLTAVEPYSKEASDGLHTRNTTLSSWTR